MKLIGELTFVMDKCLLCTDAAVYTYKSAESRISHCVSVSFLHNKGLVVVKFIVLIAELQEFKYAF